MFKYELGIKVKDVISGFSGVITGRAQHITGCNTYGVNPQKVVEGKIQEVQWFDEQRIIAVPGKKLVIKNELNGPDGKNPDGTNFSRN